MNLSEQIKIIKSQDKTFIKCLFVFISLIPMFYCTDKNKDNANQKNNANLNAYILNVTDTYHYPITPEDTLSGREIEACFEVRNKSNTTVFFPLDFGEDSPFFSKIVLRAGKKSVYPKCHSLGVNPLNFKNTDVFRARIQIKSRDLNQLGIDADTISLPSLFRELTISYFPSDHDQKHSKYNQCQSLVFSLSPAVLVEYGALYRGYH